MTHRKNERGVALLTALGLLFVFSLLGVAYVGYMTTLVEQSRYEARVTQSRVLSEAGVRLAIDKIRALRQAHQPSGLEMAFEAEVPVYRVDRQTAEGIAPRENRRAAAQVSVSEESGKININHAPAPVLQAVLGVDAATAAQIVAGLPSAGGPGPWFSSVADLVARGFMTPEAFARLDQDLVTAWSVADHANPAGSLDLNAARPEVLAAALGVDLPAAQAIAAQRPFATPQAFLAAVGKAPSTFNYAAPAGAPDALPPVFALESKAFRIRDVASVADVRPTGDLSRVTPHTVEAVVVFDGGGERITYWRQAAGAADSDT